MILRTILEKMRIIAQERGEVVTLEKRSAVKVLLINEKKEILLLCANDPTTRSIDGEEWGIFWFLVGGKIEEGESIQKAALREIFEETGIFPDKIELKQIVWYGEGEFILSGIPTLQKETFLVAKTCEKSVALTLPTEWESRKIIGMDWFSLEKIKNCKQVIFPLLLAEYLPDISSEKYPDKPLRIPLDKKPKKN